MTTSPQKRKGSAFEREVIAVLRANGHCNAERAMHFPDRGDVDGMPGFTISIKGGPSACQRVTVYWREVVKMAERTKTQPVLIVKLPGFPAGQSLTLFIPLTEIGVSRLSYAPLAHWARAHRVAISPEHIRAASRHQSWEWGFVYA